MITAPNINLRPLSAKVIQDSIRQLAGLLIPSVECRDNDGRVWIRFRGVNFSFRLRYHTMGVEGD